MMRGTLTGRALRGAASLGPATPRWNQEAAGWYNAPDVSPHAENQPGLLGKSSDGFQNGA